LRVEGRREGTGGERLRGRGRGSAWPGEEEGSESPEEEHVNLV
jgi:hypothetical protein